MLKIVIAKHTEDNEVLEIVIAKHTEEIVWEELRDLSNCIEANIDSPLTTIGKGSLERI